MEYLDQKIMHDSSKDSASLSTLTCTSMLLHGLVSCPHHGGDKFRGKRLTSNTLEQQMNKIAVPSRPSKSNHKKLMLDYIADPKKGID